MYLPMSLCLRTCDGALDHKQIDFDLSLYVKYIYSPAFSLYLILLILQGLNYDLT